MPIHASPDAKADIAKSIINLASILKTYGKQPEDMEAVTQVFLWAFGDYTHAEVRNALAYYVKHFEEFPTPSNIVNIIERKGKPPYSEATYVTISKKYAGDRTDEEWKYMKDYENWIIRGDY